MFCFVYFEKKIQSIRLVVAEDSILHKKINIYQYTETFYLKKET